jgi:glycyl-tRNA synthetase
LSQREELMELAKRRGFLWPSFELYGGVSGFYDFGPLGTLLKNKIVEKWREHFVRREESLEIDSPNLTPEEVFRASGHLEHFVDLMSECGKCGQPFKISELVREKTGLDVEGRSREEVEALLRERGVSCPECGGRLGRVFEFNTMFRTTIGPGGRKAGYLRPETAQGIFVNFRRLWRLGRERLPLPVAQIGKGYRNEISPRQGMIRLREFTMAELEVFFDSRDPIHPSFGKVAGEKLRLWRAEEERRGEERMVEMTAAEAVERGVVCHQLMAYYLALTKRFLLDLGIPEERLRFREQTPGQRAHYSRETWDAEVRTERFGWIEVAGIAYRTDYDLSRHSEASGGDLSVLLPQERRKEICHVVEPSFGIDRIFYCVLEAAHLQGKGKLWFRKELSPVEVCVFPLLRRDGLPEKAGEVLELLKGKGFWAEYDEAGSIGRRYARADEVGTPYCVTVDHRTLSDGTVTIRERETARQVRVPLLELPKVLSSLLRDELKFEKAGALLQEEEKGKEEEEGEEG